MISSHLIDFVVPLYHDVPRLGAGTSLQYCSNEGTTMFIHCSYTLRTVTRVLIVLPVLFFTFSAVVSFAFPFRAIKQGDPVPNVKLLPMESDDAELTFSGLKGKPFIVIFWGADLPEKIEYSAKIIGEIEELAPFLDERNVQRFSVNVQNDDSASVKEVVDKSKSTIALFQDDNLQAYEALGIYVIPSVLLVDKDGNVAAGMGYSRDLVGRLKGSVEIMLGEKTADQVAAELRPEMKEVSEETKAGNLHFNFGMVMIKRGLVDSAIREFSKAVEINPDMIEAHLQLGCLYLSRKDYVNAEKEINKVLAAEPESIKGNICLGEILRGKGMLEEAENLLQKIADAHPESYGAYYSLGRVLEDKKKEVEAMEKYKQAYRVLVQYTATSE